MDNVQVRNSPTLRQFLRTQPQHSQRAIIEWQEFAKTNPEVNTITSSEQWTSWALAHPGTDRFLWVGKELEVISHDPRYAQAQERPEEETEDINLPGGATFGH